MNNIYEIAKDTAPKKSKCEDCGKKTIVYLEGTIASISRTLLLERWLCAECLHD